MATHYPRSGKGRRWTVNELKALKPSWKGDYINDGEGVTGEVRVASDGAITVNFRWAFKWNGKVSWHYLGTWPHASLEAIREGRDAAKALVSKGIDPRDQKKLDRIEAQRAVEQALAAEEARKAADKTFGDMTEVWLSEGVNRKDGNAELRRWLAKDAYPALKDRPLRLVSEKDLNAVVGLVVRRGSLRMAVVLFNTLTQMYEWARKREPWRTLLREGQGGNPMELVEIQNLLPNGYDMNNIRKRYLSDAEIVELRDNLVAAEERYASAKDRRAAKQPLEKTTQIALWLCLSTLCRIGELTMAEWQHVDFEAGTWHIPLENVKGTVGEKSEHTIYLSPFALAQFKGLHSLTGDTRWCFPAKNLEDTHRCVKTVTKQVGDRQRAEGKGISGRSNDLSLVLSGGPWTPHDLRRTGATIMQGLGVDLNVIDFCQNHVLEGSKVRRHYLHHPYEKQMRAAWGALGEHIERVLGKRHLRLVA